MEITGKIIQLLETKTGTSSKGEWSKQEFIIETEGKYPKKICIANWNGKADLNGVGVGANVKVGINIESRDYNGKWYTDVTIWKFEVVGKTEVFENKEQENFNTENTGNPFD